MFKRINNDSLQNQGRAVIRDHALILSLDTAETPMVARFDLESLAQANFIVQNFEGLYQLSLRNFAGQVQPIAQFINKIDAHQALQHILQALVSYNAPNATPLMAVKSKWRFVGWFLQVMGVLFLAFLAGVYVFGNRLIIPPQPPIPAAQGTTLPEGELQDLDKLLSSAPATKE